ncbi:MAG: dihydrofolate reductase [bacterium]
MASNRVIGKDNQLPRHYSEDLKHFKEITSNHVVVMGYNTYLSIGKPLPNRRNVILSFEKVEGLECYLSIDEMLKQLESEGIQEIFIIGGASIYKQFLPLANYIYLTEIKKDYEGDTFFPVFEDEFDEVSREVHEEMDFVVYKRK